MKKELIISIIEQMAIVDNQDNVYVNDYMVEPGQFKDMTNNCYHICLNKISINPLEGDYELNLTFSISANPFFIDKIESLSSRISELLCGYDFKEIYQSQEIDYLRQELDTGERHDDTGAITFVYEVKTIAF